MSDYRCSCGHDIDIHVLHPIREGCQAEGCACPFVWITDVITFDIVHAPTCPQQQAGKPWVIIETTQAGDTERRYLNPACCEGVPVVPETETETETVQLPNVNRKEAKEA